MIPCITIQNGGNTILYHEKRASSRLRCQGIIWCTHFDQQCRANAVNISETGLCLHADMAMEAGLFIHVRVDQLSVADGLPSAGEFSWPTAAAAQVSRCRKIPHGDGYEIGLKFLIPTYRKGGSVNNLLN